MKLTDEQIQTIMQKEIVCKSILVDNENVEETIANHLKEGWKFVSKIENNGRTKLTFKK